MQKTQERGRFVTLLYYCLTRKTGRRESFAYNILARFII